MKEAIQEIEYLHIEFTDGKHKTYTQKDCVHEIIYASNGVHIDMGGIDNNGIFNVRDFYTYHSIKSIVCRKRDIDDCENNNSSD